jgi:hypothetical protein
VRALVAGLATAAALALALVCPPAPSGASFTARAGVSPGNLVRADSAANYLDLYSQGTDPDGLTGYAVKQGSSPPVVAATGASASLKLELGGWKNGGTMNRVFTIKARNTLPAPSITVTAIVPAAPVQPVSAATINTIGSAGGTTSVTLTPGAKRQVNLTIAKLPGNNLLYNATIQLQVQYTGYTGTFLTWSVPFTAWDGNGAGP